MLLCLVAGDRHGETGLARPCGRQYLPQLLVQSEVGSLLRIYLPSSAIIICRGASGAGVTRERGDDEVQTSVLIVDRERARSRQHRVTGSESPGKKNRLGASARASGL